MQITFDTANPQDLEILKQLLVLAQLPKSPSRHHPLDADAQPQVANSGSAESVVPTQSTEVSTVSGADTAPAPEIVEAPEKPKRTRRVKEEQVEMVLEVAETPQNEEIQPVEPEKIAVEQSKEFTIDDVRSALQAFTTKAGIDGGIQLLKTFGAQRISELKADQYAAFIAGCQQ